MKTAKRLLVVCILLIGFQGFAIACSCLQPPPPVTAASESDAVFVGTVLSVTSTNPSERFASLKIDLEVSEVFKGLQGDGILVSVFTGSDGALCGYSFEEGVSYLVYAHRNDGQLWTGICDRTRTRGNADEDLQALRVQTIGLELNVEVTNQQLQFSIQGGKSRAFYLEASSDFVEWRIVQEVTPDAALFVVKDHYPTSGSRRFFRLRERLASQGVFGLSLFLPGACLEDPERPGECLNQPFPGSNSYEVRRVSDSTGSEIEDPVVAAFVSSDDLTTVTLPVAFSSVLDSQQVSEDLRQLLAVEGITLSESARIQVQSLGRSWLLIDSTDQQVLFISKENQSLTVVRTGSFRVALPVGDFCVWSFFGCDRQISVSEGEWQFQILQVALP